MKTQLFFSQWFTMHFYDFENIAFQRVILKSHYGKNARNQILKMFLTLSAIFFPTSTTSDVGVVIWLARNNYLHNLCVAFSLYGLFILHVTCFINFFIECISYGSPQFSATLISFILCTSLAFSISFACFYFFVFGSGWRLAYVNPF